MSKPSQPPGTDPGGSGTAPGTTAGTAPSTTPSKAADRDLRGARAAEPWEPAALARGPAIRLLPRVDDSNRFFWTSGADGRLRFLRCGSCRRYFHPPQPRCPWCLADHVGPETVSGRGTVVSFTCNVHPWVPGSDPYLLGLVAIDEQPDVRLTTNLVGTELDAVHCGLAVEVVFEQHDEIYLPLFRPASDSPAMGPHHDRHTDAVGSCPRTVVAPAGVTTTNDVPAAYRGSSAHSTGIPLRGRGAFQ